MLSKFVGETEKNVRDLFADAEQDQRTKGIVFVRAKVTNSHLFLWAQSHFFFPYFQVIRAICMS